MKNIFLFLLPFLLSSCGKDSTVSDNLFVTNMSSSDNLFVTNMSSSEFGSIDSLEIEESSKGISWKKDWTFALSDVLSSEDFSEILDIEMNQDDLDLVGCTNYNQLSLVEKKMFLIVFISAISEAESDFEIGNKTYNRGDSTMNIGLLQIDVASAKRHSGKKYSVEEDQDLKDPIINLKVGAHIFYNQVTSTRNRGRLFPRKTYYWQVLSGSKRRILKNFKLNKHNLDFCRF